MHLLFNISSDDFYVHISVHHKSMYLEDQRDEALSSLYLFYCQVTLQVSGVSHANHQEYTNCSYNLWYKSWIWKCSNKIHLKRVQLQLLDHGLFLKGFYQYMSKFMTCTSGCNFSLGTPDDGRGRHTKRVEWPVSKIDKDCLELHLFGLLNT
jgi:hypothetical protein